jgi:hypothetical protein
VQSRRPEGLDAVAWTELADAYGPAGDVPPLLVKVAGNGGSWDDQLGDLLNRLLHQGSCYSASAPALAVLARMITADSLPAASGRDLYCALIWAAGLRRDDIIADADQAAALGRPAAH